MATRAASRISDALQVECPISRLFEAPTIAEQAVLITQALAMSAGTEEISRLLAALEAQSAPEDSAGQAAIDASEAPPASTG